VRAIYLEYPDEEVAYDRAWSQYFYGPDLLVAPAVTPGNSTSTAVWLPPGRWTHLFSGATYAGNTVQTVTTNLNAMLVFLRAGGLLVTRSDNPAGDRLSPMKALTVTVASGASCAFTLCEDDGVTARPEQSATTAMTYSDTAAGSHMLPIEPAFGSFSGQVTERRWTVVFMNADAPQAVLLDGSTAPSGSWRYAAATRRLTVQVPARPVSRRTGVAWR